MPSIRPSSDLRNNYSEISEFCHKYNEPVYITKNGLGDLAVMSIKNYEKLVGKFELYKLIKNRTAQVPESFYLLAPLYNDALHMDLKNENSNKNKVKSICLKLDNLVVKKIVSEIFV